METPITVFAYQEPQHNNPLLTTLEEQNERDSSGLATPGIKGFAKTCTDKGIGVKDISFATTEDIANALKNTRSCRPLTKEEQEQLRHSLNTTIQERIEKLQALLV
jgi:hypothetical protein